MEASDGLEEEATSLLSAVIGCIPYQQCPKMINANEDDEACDSTAVPESEDETHLFRQGSCSCQRLISRS